MKSRTKRWLIPALTAGVVAGGALAWASLSKSQKKRQRSPVLERDPESDRIHEESIVVDLHAHPSLKVSLFNRTLTSRVRASRSFDPFGVRTDFGDLKEGGRSFAVRAMGQFESLEEIRRLRFPTPLGGIVYLDEIADVVDTSADPATIARLNGRPTVGIDILRQSDANTVAVSEGIHEAIEELNEQLPSDIEFTVFNDSAEDTREVPIVVLTGLTRLDDFFGDLGELPRPDAMVEKPIDRESFLATVEGLIGG